MLTLNHARTIISAGFAKAAEMGLKPMAIVVLDAGGHVIAFERQDGSPFIRFDIAQGKAWGAIAMGTSSRWFHDTSETRPHFVQGLNAVTGGRIITVPGGLRVLDANGVAIGAVGVTGDTSDNDEIVAAWGIAAAGLAAG